MAQNVLGSTKAKASTSNQPRNWLKTLPAYLFLGAWSLFTIIIIGWIGLASVKSNREVFREPWNMPTELQFENYERAWDAGQLGQNFTNSLLIVQFSIRSSVIINTAFFTSQNPL